mgnify:CR=1 FL=1
MLADSVLSSGKCPYTTSKVNTSSSDGPAPVCTQLMLTPTTPRSGPNGRKMFTPSSVAIAAKFTSEAVKTLSRVSTVAAFEDPMFQHACRLTGAIATSPVQVLVLM